MRRLSVDAPMSICVHCALCVRVQALVEECQDPDPQRRPSFEDALARLMAMAKGAKSAAAARQQAQQ